MDAEGILAHVLHPNIGGFGSAAYLQLGSPILALDCLRAYNDFLVDWCSADPGWVLPVAARRSGISSMLSAKWSALLASAIAAEISMLNENAAALYGPA